MSWSIEIVWKFRKLLYKLSLVNSRQFSFNSGFRLTRTWELRKLAYKLSLQLFSSFDQGCICPASWCAISHSHFVYCYCLVLNMIRKLAPQGALFAQQLVDSPSLIPTVRGACIARPHLPSLTTHAVHVSTSTTELRFSRKTMFSSQFHTKE